MQRNNIIATTTLLLALISAGCASNIKPISLTDMESFALCQSTKQALETEKAIQAEYGFKRFADNAYSPVVDKKLLGHKIRLVIINDKYNIVYVSGEPSEFEHHFGYILKEITCKNGICQAPINKKQTLKFYKAKIKQSKYTTVVECNKLPQKEAAAE